MDAAALIVALDARLTIRAAEGTIVHEAEARRGLVRVEIDVAQPLLELVHVLEDRLADVRQVAVAERGEGAGAIARLDPGVGEDAALAVHVELVGAAAAAMRLDDEPIAAAARGGEAADARQPAADRVALRAGDGGAIGGREQEEARRLAAAGAERHVDALAGFERHGVAVGFAGRDAGAGIVGEHPRRGGEDALSQGLIGIGQGAAPLAGAPQRCGGAACGDRHAST